MDASIRLENVSKTYRPKEASYDTLRQAFSSLVGKKRRAMEEVAALRDVSFAVSPGEIVGVLGRNGAGKSTLLKVLSRVTPPSSGSFSLRGRVGALLEVGTGFHPELTGRQNIFLNGTLLGMSRREIARKLDSIVDFSEVEAFLDTPVKYYSSGMYMRLAFAVAAHLEPEILLIDEVLAVGDAAFQQKCLKKVREQGGLGRTIIFVSHNMDAVTSLCTRAIHLEDGKLVADGRVAEVVKRYLEGLELKHDSRSWQGEMGDEQLRLRRIELVEPSKAQALDTADDLLFRIEVDIRARVVGLVLGLEVFSSSERMLAYSAFDDSETGPPREIAPGRYAWTVRVSGNTFAPGSYFFRPLLSIANRKVVVEGNVELRLTLFNTRGIGRRYVNPFDGVFRPAWRWTPVAEITI